MNNVELALQLLLQIAVILLFCRLVGLLAVRLGQPQVVAEMIAGVLLGPSCFGLLLPDWQQALFPWDRTQGTRDTQSYLYPASQLGLALYMFVVGLEFRFDLLRQRLRSSIAVSIAGMAAPLGLGAALGWVLFAYTEFFPPGIGLVEAMLFLGASMCITAFPMLARIVQFKNLTGTTVGTVAIGAGAINDAAAWCLLAVVLAGLDDSAGHAFLTIGGGLGYVIAAVAVFRPALSRATGWLSQHGKWSDAGLVLALACMSLGAWFTELIGLHAVFGAFVMGAVMPRGAMARGLTDRIQPLSVALLLPLYFVYTGLNTRITLLSSWTLWALCGLVLLAAIASKCVACWLAARATGFSNREALGIGVLMNTRGLMELIIISIGLERGIISEGLYAALVIMAVVTTLMASPVFDWLAGGAARRQADPADPAGVSRP